MMLIYKVVHASDWETAQEKGVYAGSAKDREDGFLHFSTSTQLRETIERYYAGVTDLVLVAVDAKALVGDLKWEHSLSRNDHFPHLFAALPLSAVKWHRPILRDTHGDPIFYPLT